MASYAMDRSMCICHLGSGPTLLMASHAGQVSLGAMLQTAATVNDTSFYGTFGTCSATGSPCLPAPTGPWAPGMPSLHLRGAAALREHKDLLICLFGGVIVVVTAAQQEVIEATPKLPKEPSRFWALAKFGLSVWKSKPTAAAEVLYKAGTGDINGAIAAGASALTMEKASKRLGDTLKERARVRALKRARPLTTRGAANRRYQEARRAHQQRVLDAKSAGETIDLSLGALGAQPGEVLGQVIERDVEHITGVKTDGEGGEAPKKDEEPKL